MPDSLISELNQKLECNSPFYFYNFNTIDRQCKSLEQHLPKNFRVHYTLKANSNLAVCHRLAQLGAGADIAFSNEI
ncbi:hypothetical protein [Spirulina sp. CS-785/01]|uniref:hypothetical protein n=1 Tax=Spirulina sp. CS-785/01 TaxID=3021716 RepID=UPI003FA73A8C